MFPTLYSERIIIHGQREQKTRAGNAGEKKRKPNRPGRKIDLRGDTVLFLSDFQPETLRSALIFMRPSFALFLQGITNPKEHWLLQILVLVTVGRLWFLV